MKTIPEYKTKERTFFSDKALMHASKVGGFNSAVFFIVSFNRWIRWQPKDETPPPITPEEIFGTYDEMHYLKAVASVTKLLDDIAYVGAAACGYSGSGTIEDARARMKNENPGFDQECYERAEAHSRQAMR